MEETTHQSRNFLKEALGKPIHKFLEDSEEKLIKLKTLKTEFLLSEATNKRTKIYDLFFDAVETIKSSLVANEQLMFISGNIVAKIRLSSLSEVDSLALKADCRLACSCLVNSTYLLLVD
ncbi:hypothetical protein TNCT_535171 [Trichonephila clavata]|uniref:Uncharacterized protein n=1 Tax=Trichonephila clavata TaxID=2740835 RepID=A0A8X6FP18_TRICU|nr:hypothetical protein TNCT_535171 [Trichonephila clavata]